MSYSNNLKKFFWFHIYFSEQFSPVGENMITGGKEKLKLGLWIYTIKVQSLKPYNVAVHDSVRLQWADTTEFWAATFLGEARQPDPSEPFSLLIALTLPNLYC